MSNVDSVQTLLRTLAVDDSVLHQNLLNYFVRKGWSVVDSYHKDQDFMNYDFFIEFITDKSNLIEDRYSLFRYMTVRAFSEGDYNVEVINYLYRSLLNEFSANICINYSDRKNKKVFIFCDLHAMNESHAPTLIINRWSEAFSQKGMIVEVISTPFYTFPFPLKKSIRYNRLTSAGGEHQLMDNVYLTEIPGAPTQEFSSWAEYKKISKDDVFILIGNLNFHFDLIDSNNKFVHPTVNPSYIYSSANFMIYFNQVYNNVMNLENRPMHFIQSPLDYGHDESSNCVFTTRVVEKNMPVNLVVVGNRLEDELKQDFWDTIDFLVQKKSDIFLHVVGKFHKKIPDRLRKNVILAGYQKDLCDFYKDMHIYINPPRIGGGTTALLAIKSGLPVVTEATGDAFMAINRAYYVESFYQDLYEFVNSYTNNTDFKKQIDELSFSVAEWHKSGRSIDNAVEEVLVLVADQ